MFCCSVVSFCLCKCEPCVICSECVCSAQPTASWPRRSTPPECVRSYLQDVHHPNSCPHNRVFNLSQSVCFVVYVCVCVSWPLLASLFHPSFESVCDIQSSNCQVWPPHSSPRPAYQHCVTLTTANYHRDGDLGFAEYRYISFNKLPPPTVQPHTQLTTCPHTHTHIPPSHSLLPDGRFTATLLRLPGDGRVVTAPNVAKVSDLKGNEMNLSPWYHWSRVIDFADQRRFRIKSAAAAAGEESRRWERGGRGIKSTMIRIHVWGLRIVSPNNIWSYLISARATSCFILHKRIRCFFFLFLFFLLLDCLQRGCVSCSAFIPSLAVK